MTWRTLSLVLLVATGLSAVSVGCGGKSHHGFFIANSPVSITITPSAGLPADGATTASVTVVARDKTTGNLVQGEMITLTATGEGNVIRQPGPTDKNGVAQGGIASTVAGTKVVTATDSTGHIASASVTFVSAPSSSNATLAIVSGDQQSATTAGVLANPLIVKVTDPSGQPVAGVPVIFTVTSGGGVLSITSTSTDASGVAKSTLRVGSQPGDNTVTVIARGTDGNQIAGSPVVFHELGTSSATASR